MIIPFFDFFGMRHPLWFQVYNPLRLLTWFFYPQITGVIIYEGESLN